MKSSKDAITKGTLSGSKCTKIDVGWGFAPDPTQGAYSAPPDPLTGFKGPTSKGKGRGWGGGGVGEGLGAGGGRGWGNEPPTPWQNPGYAPDNDTIQRGAVFRRPNIIL